MDTFSSKSIRETASGEKVYLGANNVEFTDKAIEEIKFDLEKGDKMGQREMSMLIAAQERSTIENHFEQFENLNAESAEFLILLGLSHLVQNYSDSFRDKFRGRVKTLLGGEPTNQAEMEGQYEQAKLAGEE